MNNKLLKQIKYAIEFDLQDVEDVTFSNNENEDILYLEKANGEKFALALVQTESIPMTQEKMSNIIFGAIKKSSNQSIKTITCDNDGVIFIECKGGEEFGVYINVCKK